MEKGKIEEDKKLWLTSEELDRATKPAEVHNRAYGDSDPEALIGKCKPALEAMLRRNESVAFLDREGMYEVKNEHGDIWISCDGTIWDLISESEAGLAYEAVQKVKESRPLSVMNKLEGMKEKVDGLLHDMRLQCSRVLSTLCREHSEEDMEGEIEIGDNPPVQFLSKKGIIMVLTKVETDPFGYVTIRAKRGDRVGGSKAEFVYGEKEIDPLRLYGITEKVVKYCKDEFDDAVKNGKGSPYPKEFTKSI